MWNEIRKICRKTVDDLTNILRGLKDFLLKVQPEDQSKRKNKYQCFVVVFFLTKCKLL